MNFLSDYLVDISTLRDRKIGPGLRDRRSDEVGLCLSLRYELVIHF
jgi:hypothetical protein